MRSIRSIRSITVLTNSPSLNSHSELESSLSAAKDMYMYMYVSDHDYM